MSDEEQAIRQDERSQTLKDVQAFFVEGLGKIGIEVRENISLSEILTVIESLRNGYDDYFYHSEEDNLA